MRLNTSRLWFFIATIIAALLIAAPASGEAKKTSCVACHSNAEETSEEDVALVKHYADDIHQKVRLSCHDCHGGNPDPKLADDYPGAMDSDFAPNPYIGAPLRKDIPQFCGRCHSSPEFMKKYEATPRVDQVTEYWTSRHGQRLREGDEKVATCIDCHGVHGMRGVDDPKSKVYPTAVAETCSNCHSDAGKMNGRKSTRGIALAVDQHARWKASVHANALHKKGDLTAPTCNDCHGNHGATPPGVDAVVNVCGSCHGREAELFRNSAKHEGYVDHDDFLASEPAGCAGCHDGLPSHLNAVTHFGDCVSCHENHGIVRPTVALIGFLPDTPCAFCHEGKGPLARQLPEPKKKADRYVALRGELLQKAHAMKLDGEARFDWLVDQTVKLPTHTLAGDRTRLRPEFQRLFDKFRIGKTHYTYKDPTSGKDVRVAVRRCTDCHLEGAGRDLAQEFMNSTREVTSLTARAERIFLGAKRGGVEVRNVHASLDAAVDKQVELEVLVHTFASDGAFREKHRAALDDATSALRSGQASLAELSYRRKGLSAALGIIVLVLAGLAVKIKEVSKEE